MTASCERSCRTAVYDVCSCPSVSPPKRVDDVALSLRALTLACSSTRRARLALPLNRDLLEKASPIRFFKNPKWSPLRELAWEVPSSATRS